MASSKAVAEQGTGHPFRSQATKQDTTPGLEQINQSEDSIKQNTTDTSLLLINVPLLEEEPKSAYKMHRQ